ncbi:hypothetical protein E2C01_045452 [Portunus trituberculatus]|uniref:Uncharacterized protein n=1 Tax=Portunus trituberculatus TaxID=210409 RepID=A0A5B7G2X5_PORTR|nr:hypothetical protein [Portunus trituberculatus]
MRDELAATDWQATLSGNAEKARAVTSHLVNLQARHAPHRANLAKASNSLWFGFCCREAAKAKHEACRRYKQRP